MATLLVDNYDSYTFNLFQLLASVTGSEPVVVQNDDFGGDWDALCRVLVPGVDFARVVISPGPGAPHVAADVGLSKGAALDGRCPVLGVCLGHQLLAHVGGASVKRAREPMHGRLSAVEHDGSAARQPGDMLFGIPSPFQVVRYHSLEVLEDSLPPALEVVARCACGDRGTTVMALRATAPGRLMWGVQFHPESICSQFGDQLVRNFEEASRRFWAAAGKHSMPRDNKAAPRQLPSRQQQTSPCVGSRAPEQVEHKEDPVSARMMLRVERLDIFADGEEPECWSERIFAALFDPAGDAARQADRGRFWLDSATRDSLGAAASAAAATTAAVAGAPAAPCSRFSYMGDSSGPLARLVEAFVSPETRSFAATGHDTTPPQHTVRVSLMRGADWTPAPPREQAGADEDVFDYLERVLETLRRETVFCADAWAGAARPVADWDLPFPFAGGFVGYFGYGLRRLCGVKSTGVRSAGASAKPGHPASSKLPATKPLQPQPVPPVRAQPCGADRSVPEAAFLFADRFVAWDHDSGECFLVTLHDIAIEGCEAAQDAWRAETRSRLQTLATGVSKVAPPAPQGAPAAAGPDALRTHVSDKAYEEKIGECIELIRAGETYEVCLTKQLSSDTPAARELLPRSLEVYRRLRALNPAPYAVFMDVRRAPCATTDSALLSGAAESRSADFAICCSSPERFLRVEASGRVESKPIKGTIRRGRTLAEDHELAEQLRTSVKDRAENLMIVDLVRNDLGRVCEVGSVTVPKLMHIESYASVHQLVTTVQGQLPPSRGALAAIRAAFPGGSMTGAPKLRTMKIIDEIEPDERGVYSGALGFLSLTGASDLNIVIRTAIISPGGVSVGTGGAIVVLSDPGEEVEETKLKARKLQTSLGPFVSN